MGVSPWQPVQGLGGGVSHVALCFLAVFRSYYAAIFLAMPCDAAVAAAKPAVSIAGMCCAGALLWRPAFVGPENTTTVIMFEHQHGMTDATVLQLRLWWRAKGASDPGSAQWGGDRHCNPRHVSGTRTTPCCLP